MRCAAAPLVLVSKIDSSFRQVIHQALQRYPIAGKDANVILADTSGRVCADQDAIVERDAVAAVWQYFVNNAVEFQSNNRNGGEKIACVVGVIP